MCKFKKAEDQIPASQWTTSEMSWAVGMSVGEPGNKYLPANLLEKQGAAE